MPGQIEDAQATLNRFYALRTSLLVALNNPGADVLSYQIGDRNVSVRSMADIEPLNRMISYYESIVVGDIEIKADMGGLSNLPVPSAVSGFGWN
jgi:hypothetical protein